MRGPEYFGPSILKLMDEVELPLTLEEFSQRLTGCLEYLNDLEQPHARPDTAFVRWSFQHAVYYLKLQEAVRRASKVTMSAEWKRRNRLASRVRKKHILPLSSRLKALADPKQPLVCLLISSIVHPLEEIAEDLFYVERFGELQREQVAEYLKRKAGSDYAMHLMKTLKRRLPDATDAERRTLIAWCMVAAGMLKEQEALEDRGDALRMAIRRASRAYRRAVEANPGAFDAKIKDRKHGEGVPHARVSRPKSTRSTSARP